MFNFVKPSEIDITDTGARYTIGKFNDGYHSYLKVGTLVGMFNGVQSFLNYLQTEMAEPRQSKSSSKSGSSNGNFNTFETYEEAMDVYMNHPDRILEFKEIDDEVRVWDEIGNIIYYDIIGDFVDIGRYMHGVPEVFGSLHDGNPKRHRINITLNLSWVASTDREVINTRLQHVLATIDWLERNNIRCAVTAVESTEVAHVEILVKDYDEVLDLRELAIVSHGDFLRRAMFRFDEYSDTWDYGYGSAVVSSDHARRKRMRQADSGEVLPEIELFIDSRYVSLSDYQGYFDGLRTEITECIENNENRSLVVLG